MAVTGTGTQADPFIVTNYTDFISLSAHTPVDNGWTYIQFFDDEHPNQTIDCNTYGSEFKWHTFTAYGSNYTAKGIDINLNGCTIKNLLIADGEAMFNGHWDGANSRKHQLNIHDGTIKNVFLGSATSCFVSGSYVEFHDVSISMNFEGATVIPFNNNESKDTSFDNCAMYLVGSTLSNSIMKKITLTDTDIELYVKNQNSKNMFPDCSFTDCRIQGKLKGNVYYYSDSSAVHHAALGAITTYYNDNPKTNWVNCVVDLDLTESTTQRGDGTYHIIYAYSGGINTNVMCKTHYPTGWAVPNKWNYMDHEGTQSIRSGEWLNSKGFTVVEVVGS